MIKCILYKIHVIVTFVYPDVRGQQQTTEELFPAPKPGMAAYNDPSLSMSQVPVRVKSLLFYLLSFCTKYSNRKF